MNMIKNILLCLTFVLVLASCKKKDEDKNVAPYYFTAKFDEIKKDLTPHVAAKIETDATGRYYIKIYATGETSHPHFQITVSSLEPISTRTYQSSWVYTSSNDHAGANYWPKEGSSYLSDKVFSVTFTSITPTEIKGNFSGKITQTYTDINVTEGTFFAKVM